MFSLSPTESMASLTRSGLTPIDDASAASSEGFALALSPVFCFTMSGFGAGALRPLRKPSNSLNSIVPDLSGSDSSKASSTSLAGRSGPILLMPFFQSLRLTTPSPSISSSLKRSMVRRP